jgi:plasmid stability protein
LGSSIIIRNLDADLECRLWVRAKASSRTIEAEAQEILRQALSEPNIHVNSRDLGQSIHAHFTAVGGVEMQQSKSTSRSPTKLFE